MDKDKERLMHIFWEAPNEALLDRKTTAAGMGMSMGWMELKATHGGGVPFMKCGKRCLYKKSDVIKYIDDNYIIASSTSEYCMKTREKNEKT